MYDATFRGDGLHSTPVRPPTTSGCLRDIVQVVDDRIITFDPDEKDKAKAFMERGFLPPGTKRYKDKRFMFDRVFGAESSQQNVYEATAQPLLKGLLDGYNATVFAYGVSWPATILVRNLFQFRRLAAAKLILSAERKTILALYI